MPSNNNPRGQAVNRSELAALHGVAPTTVDAWVRRKCPFLVRPARKGQNWQFDTAAISEWLQEEAVRQATTDTSSLDLDEARRRKTAAEAALAEYDLAQKRGEVVTIDDTAQAVTDDYLRVRARLLQAAPKIAPILATLATPEECQSVVEGVVEEALSELASGVLDDGDNAGGDAEPPAGDPQGEGGRATAAA